MTTDQRGPPVEVHVAAGALFDAGRRVLIARRPAGKHMAGRWELPGGKLDAGETPLEALRRELAEELGVELRDARPLIRLRHDYADRRVLLDVWRVTDWAGEPRGLDGQALEWVAPDELPARDLLEADLPIVTALRMPSVARAVAGTAGLEAALAEADDALALLWSPQPPGQAGEAERSLVARARAAGHRVLVVGDEIGAVTAAAATGADGVALDWSGEPLAVDPRGQFLVGVMCEDPDTALEAAVAGAQFVVLAPPGGPPEPASLARLCARSNLPVLVGCYPDQASLAALRAAGAHGCVLAAGPARGG